FGSALLLALPAQLRSAEDRGLFSCRYTKVCSVNLALFPSAQPPVRRVQYGQYRRRLRTLLHLAAPRQHRQLPTLPRHDPRERKLALECIDQPAPLQRQRVRHALPRPFPLPLLRVRLPHRHDRRPRRYLRTRTLALGAFTFPDV